MYVLPDIYAFTSNLYLVGFWLLLSSVVAGASVLQFILNKANISPIVLDTHILLTTGIYRFTRNPMYLSLAFALIAWFFWLGNLFSVLGIVLFIMMSTYFQIKPEERMLEKLFGKEYINYRNKVRRWI